MVTGIRVGGHPVLVLPCDERGETEHVRLLREVRDESECPSHHDDRSTLLARIDALIVEGHAPGDAGDDR